MSWPRLSGKKSKCECKKCMRGNEFEANWMLWKNEPGNVSFPYARIFLVITKVPTGVNVVHKFLKAYILSDFCWSLKRETDDKLYKRKRSSENLAEDVIIRRERGSDETAFACSILGINKMKPSMKMGVIALIGICVIFYQYHLSTGVRFDQLTGFNAAGSMLDDSSNLQAGEEFEPRITEEMIRTTVYSVQKTYGLSPDITKLLVQELLSQLAINKNGLSSRQETMINNIDRAMQTAISTTPKTLPPCQPPSRQTDKPVDPLYIVTPTYRRPEQIAELTRMSHTLMLVKNVNWLVIEDAKVATIQVTKLLQKTGLNFVHLIAPMPDKYKQKKGAKPRGVSNRNRGLQWVRANATKGVLYFADDDNTYDIALFDEIRRTKKVSMFPVGLCTKFGISSPVVKNGKFAGFYDGWVAGRKFPVDMAGFAVNIKFLLERPNASMPYRAGFEEDGFLKSLAPFEPREIELLADNCTKILAWHTQTKKNEPSGPLNMTLYSSTNLVKLKQQIV